MVHEYDASVSDYLAKIAREDLIKVRANEVLSLVSRGSPYRGQRKYRVASLTKKELRKVRSHLDKEAKSLRKQGKSIEECLDAKLSIMPDLPNGEAAFAKLEIKALRQDVRWYDLRLALYERSVAYMDQILK